MLARLCDICADRDIQSRRGLFGSLRSEGESVSVLSVRYGEVGLKVLEFVGVGGQTKCSQMKVRTRFMLKHRGGDRSF
jgi:hypothetical protein